jgi:Type II secretion system (T2SS), protein E, N-terminal domain
MSTPLRERPDAPLGTLIFRAGLLPAETIENALEEGVKTGRRLGEILIERGLLQEEDLTRLLAGQKGLPFVSLRTEPIDPEATKLLSEDQARLFSALPIRFEEGLPLVAVADPTNDVLNRNIREALGQDVRFVVAGRTELNEVIGEAYSGTLRAVAPAPVAEPEAEPEPEAELEPVEPAPLRVDTSLVPTAEEPPVPTYEPEPEAAPEPAPAFETADPEPAFESADPEPAFETADPEPAFETADPEPAFETPIYEAPVVEPEPAPEAEPAAEPEFEPVTAFESQAPAPEFAPPAPTFEAPVAPEPEPEAPLVTEPAPQSLPETNGQVPHDVEDGPLQAEPPVPLTPELPVDPAPVAAAPEALASTNGAGFTVSVRLTSGERMTVAECSDIGEAKGYAKALTKQLGTSDPDDWPFVNGRFLKPDTILSVDVESS